MSTNPRVFGTIDKIFRPFEEWDPRLAIGYTMHQGREYLFGFRSFLDWSGGLDDPRIPKLGQRISYSPWPGGLRNTAEEVQREPAD